MLQIFTINSEFNPKNVDGTLIKTRAHDSVYGAYTYEFKVNKDRLHISVMGHKLHEVLYECPRLLPWSRTRRNKFLLEAYCPGEWLHVLKNESGDLFQSNDEMYFAAWSKANDTIAFGTMVFYEEKFRLVT